MNSLRCSPLVSAYTDSACPAADFDGMAIAQGGRAISSAANALVDISAVAKRLVVGQGARQWLAQHFDVLPEAIFAAATDAQGNTLVRLHTAQYLVISGGPGSTFAEHFSAPMERARDVLIVAYESAEFALIGPYQEAVVSELSTYDPAALTPGQWIATRFAHAEVGLRLIAAPTAHLRVVCSPADARYLFGLLADIAAEHGGHLTTIDAYDAFVRNAAPPPASDLATA